MPTRETKYFQNSAGQVLYNPSGYVQLVWNAERISQSELEVLYEHTLDLLKSTGLRKILSVHGSRLPLSSVAQEWLTTYWLPRAVAEAKLSYCAVVEGANPMHRLSTQSVVAASPASIVFKHFPSTATAEAWLQHLPR